MDYITPRQFEEKMEEIASEADEWTEDSHMKADALMCEVLRSLGYEAGVAIFENMGKWYA